MFEQRNHLSINCFFKKLKFLHSKLKTEAKKIRDENEQKGFVCLG